MRVQVGIPGWAFVVAGFGALAFDPSRLSALGFLAGFGYGFGFRWLALRFGARWLLLAKVPILLLLLAGLGKVGVGALLGFPLGFMAQLIDFIVQVRRRR